MYKQPIAYTYCIQKQPLSKFYERLKQLFVKVNPIVLIQMPAIRVYINVHKYHNKIIVDYLTLKIIIQLLTSADSDTFSLYPIICTATVLRKWPTSENQKKIFISFSLSKQSVKWIFHGQLFFSYHKKGNKFYVYIYFINFLFSSSSVKPLKIMIYNLLKTTLF